MTQQTERLSPLNASGASASVRRAENGQTTEIAFEQLVVRMNQGGEAARIKTHVASFLIPMHVAKSELRLSQRIQGRVTIDPGTSVALVIHAAGHSVLVDLPKGPVTDYEFTETFDGVLSAGYAYLVTFFLLASQEQAKVQAATYLAVDSLTIMQEEPSPTNAPDAWMESREDEDHWRKGPAAGRLEFYEKQRGLEDISKPTDETADSDK